MPTIRQDHSFYAYLYVLLALTPETFALPYSSATISSSTPSKRSPESTISQSILYKRYSDNNVGAAIGPLVGAVVLLFALYVTYQWWRKRKDREYFRRKEGDPQGRGTPATISTTGVPGGTVERKPSDKSDSSAESRGSRKSYGKAVSSGGILEVMIKEEEEGIQPIPPVYSERRDSRNKGKEPTTSAPGSRRTSRESSRDRSSVHSSVSADKRDRSSTHSSVNGDRRERSSIHSSVTGERRESLGNVRLSQGAQRQVEIKAPEPVRHKAAGIRGSEYWTKNTSASQLAPE